MSPIVARWLPTLIVALTSALLIGKTIQVQQAYSYQDLLPFYPDLLRYFESSVWVTDLGGHGTLYREIFSEYPLMANLLFAVVRWANIPFGNSFVGFSVLWIICAALCTVTLCTILLRVSEQINPHNNLWVLAFACLTPGVLHFALLRFDIYPAFATLGMMICLYRRAYLQAGLWTGLGIALKGYPVFLVPAILLYIQGQGSTRSVLRFLLMTIAIPLLSLLAVYAFAGIEGLLSPFQFHGQRDFNPDSSYTLLRYLLQMPLHSNDLSPLPLVLQALCVGIPLFFRPKTFDALIQALAFTLSGVLSFSVFYSPQFIIWLLPITGLSRNRSTQFWLLTYALWTGMYFVVEAFKTTESLVVLVTGLVLLRFALMASALRKIRTPMLENTTKCEARSGLR